MTWTPGIGYGGESQDADAECVNVLGTSAVTVDSTAAYITTGVRTVKFPLATSAAKAVVRTFPSTPGAAVGRSYVFSGSFGLSATPSSEMGLLSDGAQGGNRFCRIGTDRKLRFYNSSGVQIGPASINTIPVGSVIHVVIAILANADPYVIGVGSWFIQLWMGGKLDRPILVRSASSITPSLFGYWGEYLPAATNRGADLYGDDMMARSSTSRLDRTHYAKYPVLRIVGGASLPPTSEGTHQAWEDDGQTNTHPNTHLDIDDFPHDGTTAGTGTYIATAQQLVKQTYRYSASNPLASGDTIEHVQQRVVHAITSSGKTGHNILYRDDAGNEVEQGHDGGVPGSTYVGNIVTNMNRPAGGAWVRADFDLSGGASKLQFGMRAAAAGTVAASVTALPGPEIVYSSGQTITQGVFYGRWG